LSSKTTRPNESQTTLSALLGDIMIDSPDRH
jgi:hypothetical protein